MGINFLLAFINKINKENEQIKETKKKYLNDIIQKDIIISLKIKEIERISASNNELIAQNINLKNDYEKINNNIKMCQTIKKNNKGDLNTEDVNSKEKSQIKNKNINILNKKLIKDKNVSDENDYYNKITFVIENIKNCNIFYQSQVNSKLIKSEQEIKKLINSYIFFISKMFFGNLDYLAPN